MSTLTGTTVRWYIETGRSGWYSLLLKLRFWISSSEIILISKKYTLNTLNSDTWHMWTWYSNNKCFDNFEKLENNGTAEIGWVAPTTAWPWCHEYVNFEIPYVGVFLICNDRPKSTWLLLMPWCQTGAKPSAACWLDDNSVAWIISLNTDIMLRPMRGRAVTRWFLCNWRIHISIRTLVIYLPTFFRINPQVLGHTYDFQIINGVTLKGMGKSIIIYHKKIQIVCILLGMYHITWYTCNTTM